ncbi:hypothetical protein FE257_012811 [Aspergillus nanangensis]|uniref:TeaA receptor TeaR n=1 Tax=Aspergillus nanangensis TaxID=2582783 RepID=A0AAD4CFI0_ASPNN|nr:hypothetical protein FE257_012811 [Aspergillus nanangensis]
MAGAATAAYTADVWTSSGTVEPTQTSQWEYAVPVRRSSNKHRSKSRSSHDSTHTRPRRNSKGSRSSSLSRHAYAHESGHVNSRGRQEASLARRGSEKGSLRSRSVGNSRESVDTYHAALSRGEMKEGIGLYLNEMDNENWIHRDKLAKIESQELQQILYNRRGMESVKGRRNHDVHNSTISTPPSEHTEPWPNVREDHREYSGSPTHYSGDNTPEHERKTWDLRRPEEIAGGDDAASSIYRNPGLRKSSSRIPIPTSSPAPMSPEHGGREFSGQRSRAPTNGEDDGLSFGMPRRASEPITVDSIDAVTPPGASSRPVSRGLQSQLASKKTPGKGPGSATRKTSAPPTTRKSTTSRSRAVSGNINQRPTTRSGESRPPTAVNRPEGDPPWLATMYKPDPRLPPDQQILPTHARKMQQEQWAKEGRTPTTYDREFAPLVIGPDAAPRVEPKDEKKEEEVIEEKPQLARLPSRPSSSHKANEPSTRPGTSTGYSPMPRVQDPPPTALTPKWSPPMVSAAEPPKKEKGCGCCIVM